MIANERRPVYLWHGWFEHLPQEEIHQRLMLVNMNKNWRDSVWFARKTTDCSPTLPFGRRSKVGKLWPNGICFQPPLPFPSKVTPCQVRNDQSVFLWVNLSSDLDPRSHEFVTTTETQQQKMDFSFDNPRIQFACFGLVLKRWQACIRFLRVPTVCIWENCTAKPSGLLFLRCNKRA